MPPARRTRILIVDDSAAMRSLLRSVLASDSALEVAGTATNGASVLGAVEDLRPDLVLLDVEMPIMDGLETLRALRGRGHRMPVIMCSSLTLRGARVTIDALASGASDYVAKPVGEAGPAAAIEALAQELLPRIHALVSSTSAPPSTAVLPAPESSAVQASQYRAQPVSSVPAVVVVGVSTGGPAALDVLLPSLPADFPLPVLVVQHMPELFTGLLAERLNTHCALAVREAAEGDPVRCGSIYIARGNRHLEVLAPPVCAGQLPTLHLTQRPPENHCRPSADVLLRTATAVYGSGVLAIILTGMGSDGLAGCRIARAQHATVLAQDRATSAVWGMPGAVVQAGLAHRVLPIQAIAPEVLRLAGLAVREAAEPRAAPVL